MVDDIVPVVAVRLPLLRQDHRGNDAHVGIALHLLHADGNGFPQIHPAFRFKGQGRTQQKDLMTQAVEQVAQDFQGTVQAVVHNQDEGAGVPGGELLLQVAVIRNLMNPMLLPPGKAPADQLHVYDEIGGHVRGAVQRPGQRPEAFSVFRILRHRLQRLDGLPLQAGAASAAGLLVEIVLPDGVVRTAPLLIGLAPELHALPQAGIILREEILALQHAQSGLRILLLF